MSTTAIAATNLYRNKVAIAAAGSGPMPQATHVAFGDGDAPYTLDDTELAGEFLRMASVNTVDGVMLTVLATITGAQAGAHVLREVGVFAEDGTLMGRRVLAPKEFETEMQLDFELTFQY